MFRFSAFAPLAMLLLFCSCASPAPSSARAATGSGESNVWSTSTRPSLPAEVTMNEGAGRGDLLIVMLRIEAIGEPLPFVLDTGAPGTLFDRSLAPKLTRLPLGTWTIQTLNEKQESGIFLQPALYLGNARLMTGNLAATFDMKRLSAVTGQPIVGVLGMDCLRHYCLQLDFEDRRVRFLEPSSPRTAKPGKAFPLAFSFPGGQPSIEHAGLGGETPSTAEVDTGFTLDGQVDRGAIPGINRGVANIPNCVWNGDSYHDLLVGVDQDARRLGLRFLARHLVTLDFPNRMLYLQRRSADPLLSEQAQAEGNAAAQSALSFLRSLLSEGRLPGWSPGDEPATRDVGFHLNLPNAALCDGLRKSGDPSVYHYQLVRASKSSAWTLQKAWRTDQAGRTVQKYPVPDGAP